MPYLLLQIVALPLVASVVIGFSRTANKSRKSSWIAIATLAYTTLLLGIAGLRIYAGEVIFEKYPLGPEVSLNLLADGLSLPVALIINLICVALAFYSLHYVEHRIELIYGEIDPQTHDIYSFVSFLSHRFYGRLLCHESDNHLFFHGTADDYTPLFHHGAIRVFGLYYTI